MMCARYDDHVASASCDKQNFNTLHCDTPYKLLPTVQNGSTDSIRTALDTCRYRGGRRATIALET
jgi:hypothetical protein